MQYHLRASKQNEGASHQRPSRPSYGLGHAAHVSCPLEHAVSIGARRAARHHGGSVQGHALYAKLRGAEHRPPLEAAVVP